MKKIVALLAVVAMFTSCSKIIPTKEVQVHFFESGVTVTFTGSNGTYTFTEENDTQLVPLGNYQICATWGGGCGGMRMTKETSSGEENVLLVMPQGGTECASNQHLVSEYYISVNCE